MTAGASSKPTTAARRFQSMAGRRGIGVSTSSSRKFTASATTKRIRITFAAEFKTTTRIAAHRTRSALSASRTPTGVTSATMATVRGFGREPGDPNSIWNVGINELNGQLGIFDLKSRQNYDITPDVTDTNGRALAGLPYRANWEAPIAFDALNPKVAYYGANVLFKTDDRGLNWTAISPDLTRNDPTKEQVAGGPINTDVSGAEFYDTIFDIAPSPRQAGRIWVGTDDGLVQLTTDGGVHWRNVTPPQPMVAPWGRIDTMEASTVDADRAYVAVDRHVMGDPHPYILVTDDSGSTWRTITNGLPQNQYVHVVREDPLNPRVLYAGLEQGVWISLDRGAHWESLRLNMPSVAVHDMRIQPQQHDLLVATHGRGFWVLDDVGAIAGLAAAVAAKAPMLFPTRTAYTWYRWWPSYYGTHPDECCLSAGMYAGEDPPEGALMTYYLPSSAHAWIEVLDGQGRRVRCFDAAGDAGVARTSWDLTETPPVPWLRAREWNRGGSGATVVPGHYTIALHAGKATLEQPLDVLADPRARWSQTQYVERYQFVNRLNEELSQIDTALNRLDSLTGASSFDMLRMRRVFTSGVVNSEDDQLMPDRLRERLTILQGVIALSQGPPTAAQLGEEAAIRPQFYAAMASYRSFLAAHHLPPDTKQEVCE